MSQIVVKINDSGFEYDIHSLVKAFYPSEDVKVLAGDTEEKSTEGMPDISIDFEKDSIRLLFVREGDGKEYRVNTEGLLKAQYRSELKKLIYIAISKAEGRTLPWGTLTGIRPTKIPMSLLAEGAATEEIEDYMRNTYLLNEEKLSLSIDIAKRERELLSKINYDNGYSIYIGIPFCPTTCMYCSFTSYPICAYKNKTEAYLEALFKEIDYTAEAFKDKELNTLYIGGGTPTTLEADELDRLLTKIYESFDMTNLKELTVEAGRADSITEDKLRVLKKHNVGRISVNPQTMNQKTLDLIGRRHTVEQVVDTFALARKVGFENINMDIILGLPNENVSEVTYTIDEIKKLAPDSLTVHSLALKRASKMSEWIEKNGLSTLNNTDETMDIARRGAADMGMNPYYLYRQKNMSGNFENVGYSAPGKEGIYNILIMEEVQTIVALGAGSVTKRVYGDGRIERCDNVKDVALYISKIEEMIDRKRQLFKD